MGREHEDLVLVTGRLESAISFNCVVDWLSPTKVRRTRVLGERGMLVADTLTADLTFYENGDVARSGRPRSRCAASARATRRATRWPAASRCWSSSRRSATCSPATRDAPVVTLAEGLETVLVAEAVLASARGGETVAVEVAT